MQTKIINLIVPRGWHELDDKQLRYLFGLLADDYSSAEIRTLCLFRWAEHSKYLFLFPYSPIDIFMPFATFLSVQR